MTSCWHPHPAALVVAVETAADAAAGPRIGRARCDTHPSGSMLTRCCIRHTKTFSCLRDWVLHTRSRVTSPVPVRHSSQFKNNHSRSMCSGSETGSYLRLTDSCITQLKAQGPSRTCRVQKKTCLTPPFFQDGAVGDAHELGALRGLAADRGAVQGAARRRGRNLLCRYTRGPSPSRFLKTELLELELVMVSRATK